MGTSDDSESAIGRHTGVCCDIAIQQQGNRHVTGFRKVTINAVLWGAVIGCLLGTSSSVALGVDEQASEERCAAVWQAVAVDRTDGYLSDREAAPYLAVLRVSGQLSVSNK